MSSGFLKRFYKTLGFRLASWYAAYFILSAGILIALAGMILSSSLENNNRQVIDYELEEYSSQYHKSGLSGVQEMDAQERALTEVPYYVRIAGPDNRTRFLSSFPSWKDYRIPDLEKEPFAQAKAPWRHWRGTREGYDLDLASLILTDGALLQIAASSHDRHETLERFGDMFAKAAFPMILMAFIFGFLLAHRGLLPVRELIERMNAVIQTGKMNIRFAERHTSDELDQLGGLFNRLLEKMETLIQGMQNSLDSVAHDLRTPMTRLSGTAEVALQSPNPTLESMQEALADCVEKAGQVTTMLNTLMDISETESGALRLKLEPVPLEPLMSEIAELYSFVAEEHAIRLYYTCPKDLVCIGDRNRLRQALANLVDNAVKYSYAGGEVRLEAFVKNQSRPYVVLQVKDGGMGISPEEIPYIWDRLYRGDRSRSQRGLGLGLSLVKAIVQAHNGTTEVSSTPHQGSLFSLYLPS